MAIAGIVTLKPYWNTGWDKLSSTAADRAASKSPIKAETKTSPSIVPLDFGLNALFIAKNNATGMKTPIIPMFSTLAPRAVIPPSPNKNACRTIIMVIDMQPAKGPRISPIAAAPSKCAVVPKKTG